MEGYVWKKYMENQICHGEIHYDDNCAKSESWFLKSLFSYKLIHSPCFLQTHGCNIMSHKH